MAENPAIKPYDSSSIHAQAVAAYLHFVVADGFRTSIFLAPRSHTDNSAPQCGYAMAGTNTF